MSSFISGWDIGGAHLKVARCDQDGKIIDVIQVACPLWQGIEYLEQAIETVFKLLNNQDDLAAVTMTGELVDIFPHRQAGVVAILACVCKYISHSKVQVYAGQLGWLPPQQAGQQWRQVASRNWQASANLIAQYCSEGLFVDLGSTSCDIIPLVNHQAIPQGFDDLSRQTNRELLYTGAIRTPLISLCQTAPFNGELVGLAAEVFATTGDVWCLLAQLDSDSIQDASADNMPWTAENCARRLARLLGTDSLHPADPQWQQLAKWFAEQQIHHINKALLHVHSAHSTLSPKAPIIGAGVGRFIVQQCAQRLNQPYIDIADLLRLPKVEAADHLPAIAVALLAMQVLP